MGWTYFVYWIVTAVLAYALTPRPKIENQPPAGLGDIQAPTAEEGREIPVLFGTRDLDAPNCVWYGHLRVIPIRKKGGKK